MSPRKSRPPSEKYASSRRLGSQLFVEEDEQPGTRDVREQACDLPGVQAAMERVEHRLVEREAPAEPELDT